MKKNGLYNNINAQWKDYRITDGEINEDKITFVHSDDFGEFTKDVKKMLKKYKLKTGKDLMENIHRYAYSTKV